MVMRKDPTEFRERFKRWKQGLPAYKDGKRYLWDDQTQSWDRITDSDVANAMAEWAFTPTTTRAKFDYENTPNPAKPIQKNAVISQDNNTWTKQRVAEESNKRTWLSDAADVSHAIGEGAMIASTFAAPEIEPLVYPTYQAAKQAVSSVLTSNTPVMQYLRYPVGKLMYGFDAQFPTLYRKLKTLPTEPNDGMLQISNPNPRFAFEATGEESPIITNFSYDAPVRKHGTGDWNVGYTLAMPGRKTLLGRNVVSTEPSDLFTFGDNIKIPARDVTMISGDADEISLASKYGLNVKTSPEIQKSYQEGFGKSLLEKDDHSKYAKEVELFTRKLFGSPRKKDVDFMNFVLQPKIKGAVYNPNQLDYLIREGIKPFGDRIGNAELRPYFLDPDRWKHLLYDPATHAEANFRKANGIVLKKKIPLNKRK